LHLQLKAFNRNFLLFGDTGEKRRRLNKLPLVLWRDWNFYGCDLNFQSTRSTATASFGGFQGFYGHAALHYKPAEYLLNNSNLTEKILCQKSNLHLPARFRNNSRKHYMTEMLITVRINRDSKLTKNKSAKMYVPYIASCRMHYFFSPKDLQASWKIHRPSLQTDPQMSRSASWYMFFLDLIIICYFTPTVLSNCHSCIRFLTNHKMNESLLWFNFIIRAVNCCYCIHTIIYFTYGESIPNEVCTSATSNYRKGFLAASTLWLAFLSFTYMSWSCLTQQKFWS